MMKQNTATTSDRAGGHLSAFGSGRSWVRCTTTAAPSPGTADGRFEEVPGLAWSEDGSRGSGAFLSIAPMTVKSPSAKG